MELVKSTTYDCTTAAKAGYAEALDESPHIYSSSDSMNQGAYKLGQYLGSRMLGRPSSCVAHKLAEGGTHYVVITDTFQTGGVFTVNPDDTVHLIHRSALQAGYR